jgi:hypothetical protein
VALEISRTCQSDLGTPSTRILSRGKLRQPRWRLCGVRPQAFMVVVPFSFHQSASEIT